MANILTYRISGTFFKKKAVKDKKDLIETVLEQMIIDVHCNDLDAIKVFLENCDLENLINYLPENDWKKFKHLRNEKTD